MVRRWQRSHPQPAAVQTAPPVAPSQPDVRPPVRRGHFLVAWYIGSVLASLIPLGLIALHDADLLAKLSIFQILGRGDLLLIAFTLTIAGVAQLLPFVTRLKSAQLFGVILEILGGFVVAAMEIAWYSDIAARISAQVAGGSNVKAPPIHLITFGSVFMFAVTVVITTFCVSTAASCS